MGRSVILRAAALAAVAIVGSTYSNTAKAALVLTLTPSVGAPVTITDNGAGDSDPALGSITNIGAVGGFSTNIGVGGSNSPGTSTAGLLQIQSLDIRNTTAGQQSLTIVLSDTDYGLPGGTNMTLGSNIGGTLTQATEGDSA